MSINFNRSKAKQCLSGRELKLKVIYEQDPYRDECWSYRKGLLPYKYRMYRSWKHNRKNQYQMKT